MNIDPKSSRTFMRDQRGLTTVEYIIVLGLIAVVGIAAWQQFGETLIGEVEAADGYISDVVQ
jgi:Flp pilus assembly pilin Flp